MSEERTIKDLDIPAALSLLVSESARIQATMEVILRELAEMRSKGSDLMGDGQQLSSDEIYKKFLDEIDRRSLDLQKVRS